MQFSERLKQARKHNKISQEQLAERLNVSPKTISRWESGEGEPSFEQLKYLKDLFGLSIYDEAETVEQPVTTAEPVETMPVETAVEQKNTTENIQEAAANVSPLKTVFSKLKVYIGILASVAMFFIVGWIYSYILYGGDHGGASVEIDDSVLHEIEQSRVVAGTVGVFVVDVPGLIMIALLTAVVIFLICFTVKIVKTVRETKKKVK